MYSYGPPHTAGQKQDDQHEHTFSSYVRIRDVALKTSQRRWTIERSGERGSGISVLMARSRDELIRDVPLWTPTYSREKAGQPARTYIQQFGEDKECSPEDLPEAMNDREKWRERVRDIRASGTKQGRAHTWCTPMDPHVGPRKSRMIS